MNGINSSGCFWVLPNMSEFQWLLIKILQSSSTLALLYRDSSGVPFDHIA